MITVDSASNSGAQGAQSTYSWSHTCKGNARVLVVGIFIGDTTTTVSTVKYNTVALTKIDRQVAASNVAAELWALINPVGDLSASITVTFSTSTNSASGAVSIKNAYQPTQPDNKNKSTGSTSPHTTSVTPVGGGCLLVDIVATNNTISLTVDPSQTQRNNVTIGANGILGMSTKDSTNISTAMSWTPQASTIYAQIVASIAGVPTTRINNLRPRAFAPGLAR